MQNKKGKGDWMKAMMKGIAGGCLLAVVMSGCAIFGPKPLVQARAAWESGAYSKAAEQADAALAVNDRSMEALYIRGMSAIELKDYQMGCEMLTKAQTAYEPGSEEGLAMRKQMAKAYFQMQKFPQAEAQMNEYINIKQSEGRLLQEDDYYWAGTIADVNMKDQTRDAYWAHLSRAFKKSKGIQ
jgi:tetratricopeptide (TPR) repeat protein